MMAVKLATAVGVFGCWLATDLAILWLCVHQPENMLAATFLLWTLITVVATMWAAFALTATIERHEEAMKAQKRKG